MKSKGVCSLLAAGSICCMVLIGPSSLRADVFANVPEASEYTLVYDLAVPNRGGYTNAPYSVDHAASVTGPFDRIAYYLELQTSGGSLEYAYVSMRAFTQDATKIGVPTQASGAFFQQTVDDLHIATNAPGKVAAGTGVTTGNIEFWSNCYSTDNAAAVPNASATVYDVGDAPNSSVNCYGSMQVHNYASGLVQTIFAYNDFARSGFDSDLGIGNRMTGHPDWTFAYNAAGFTVKRLQVMVRAVGQQRPAEAADYELVYVLPIPAGVKDLDTVGVPYLYDRSAAVNDPFARVGYLLELQQPGQPRQYVWTSMDAFTTDPLQIGVPTQASGAMFQQNVANLQVVSNVAGVSNGEFATSGNVEFWSNCYGTENSANVPNASASVYDTGDRPTSDVACYGSMQVHNHDANQVLWAYNAWSYSQPHDVGIGNCPTGSHPDWTFRYNAGSYVLKTLSVYVSNRPSILANIPEAANYELVYMLSIPATAVDFNTTGVPYAIDRSALVEHTFERVAYYLELQPSAAPTQYLWVSLDAFANDPALIGVPTVASGAFFQQEATNLHVFSNVEGVTEGEFAEGGNIEFWPNNYAQTNSAGIPGASAAVYDFGDQPVTPVDGYGSMQVHHYDLGEVLFAYNAWGTASAHDLGIGNCPAGSHPDWTFRYNAASYTSAKLYVYVEQGAPPVLAVRTPLSPALLQRDVVSNAATFAIGGSHDGQATHFEVRALAREGFGGSATDWLLLDDEPGPDSFSGILTLTAGWYDLEVRALQGETVLGGDTVRRVGVGDIFITAGQSNSANHGNPPQTPTDERVLCHDLATNWRVAYDPQPIATGSGGTPWPDLGDILAGRYDVPIGFVSVGWGGTSVAQWQPGVSGSMYPRLQQAVDYLGPEGFRAILWHQGETDNNQGMTTATYVQHLQTLIAQSRSDAGFAAPWGVALVSYTPTNGSVARILDAQQQVIDADPLVFLGAATDDLIGAQWRFDGIHFNDAGLYEHALRWADAMDLSFCSDGQCNGGETCDSCAEDCGFCCGDGCDDDNPCTLDVCDAQAGCVSTALDNGVDCDDGDACNGLAVCQQGQCVLTEPYAIGDVNNDASLTAGDAQLTFFIGLGTYGATAEEACAADCNQDGMVTSADAQQIFFAALGVGGCETR